MLTLIIPVCVFGNLGHFRRAGHGGGMILMGCLVSLLPVATAIIIHAAAQFVANGSRAVIHRRYIVCGTVPLCHRPGTGNGIDADDFFCARQSHRIYYWAFCPLRNCTAAQIDMNIRRPW